MTGQQMTRLARTFPTFSRNKPNAPGLDPWDADKLIEASGCWSGGERRTLMFLLSVWNGEIAEYTGVWDANHLEAFAAWAAGLAHEARSNEDYALSLMQGGAR